MNHWLFCDHCHERDALLSTNGGSFCSIACMTLALEARRLARQERQKQFNAARKRQEDQALLSVYVLMLLLLCYGILGGDQARDEAKEAQERQSLYGRVSWEVGSR